MKHIYFKRFMLLILLLVYRIAYGYDITLINKERVTVDTLGVIVNTADAQSVKVAEYYVAKRGIPKENIIRVNFKVVGVNINAIEFQKLKEEIDKKTPSHIQAYAITWTSPYKVDCMSMTSAMAFGFDHAYCGGCVPTKPSAYFNSKSQQPYTEFKMRPSMLLAGESTESVFKLIDLGISADSTFPTGDAFLVKDGEGSYSVRATQYQETQKTFSPIFRTYLQKPVKPPFKRNNILFYFDGSPVINNLNLMSFLPGAMADHLTSFGGDILEHTGQTKAIKWLNAGATASYGTVLEPCNFTQKFPMPAAAMYHYFKGNALIEAYWKSVQWPGEGLFIGEPLAAPFAPAITELSSQNYELRLFSSTNSIIKIFSANSMMGPYVQTTQQKLFLGYNKIPLRFDLNNVEHLYIKYEIIEN